MDSKALFNKLKQYFLNKPDLMRHLHGNACWEYVIYESSLDDQEEKLCYILYKNDNNKLKVTKKKPELSPDLILYFTQNSILKLIENNPSADQYFQRYHDLMYNSAKKEIDSKINKSRLTLLRLGYQKWQKDFKF